MRKRFLIIMVGVIISMPSCYHRLCPTYTTNPNNIEKLEKAKADQQEISIEEKENV